MDNGNVAKYDQVMIHAPAAPTDVTITGVTKSSAIISWMPPAGDLSAQADKYKFRVRAQGASHDTALYDSTDIVTTTATIPTGMLVPGTTYDVYVSAGNVDGYGPEAKATFTTEAGLQKMISSVEFSEADGKTLTVTGSNLVGADDNPWEYISALDRSFVKLNGVELPFCSQGLGVTAQQMIDIYTPYYPNIAQLISDNPPCYDLVDAGGIAITQTKAIIHLPADFDTAAQGTVSVNGSPAFNFNKRPNATPTATVNGTKPIAQHPKVPKLPIFSGMATPGAVVTVTVRSDPIVCTATANEQGNWSCTLPKELPAGEHTATIHVVNPDSSTVDMGPYPLTVGEIAAVPVLPITNTKAVVAKIKEVQQKQQEVAKSPNQPANSDGNTTGNNNNSGGSTTAPTPINKPDEQQSTETNASNPWVAWGIAFAAFIGVGVTFFIILLAKRRKKAGNAGSGQV